MSQNSLRTSTMGTSVVVAGKRAEELGIEAGRGAVVLKVLVVIDVQMLEERRAVALPVGKGPRDLLGRRGLANDDVAFRDLLVAHAALSDEDPLAVLLALDALGGEPRVDVE